jgi:hypothetical protein
MKEQTRKMREEDVSSLEHAHSLMLQCHNISDNRIAPALRGQGARLGNAYSLATSATYEAEQSDRLINQLEDAIKFIHVPTSCRSKRSKARSDDKILKLHRRHRREQETTSEKAARAKHLQRSDRCDNLADTRSHEPDRKFLFEPDAQDRKGEENIKRLMKELRIGVRGLKGIIQAHGAEMRHQNDTVHGTGVKTDQVEDRVVVGNAQLKDY